MYLESVGVREAAVAMLLPETWISWGLGGSGGLVRRDLEGW